MTKRTRPQGPGSWRSSARMVELTDGRTSVRAGPQEALGRLCQGTRDRASLSLVLPPWGRDLQRSPHRLQRGRRHLQVQGYRRSGADRQQVVTLAADEFINPLPLHTCRGIPSHPTLRPARWSPKTVSPRLGWRQHRRTGSPNVPKPAPVCLRTPNSARNPSPKRTSTQSAGT